MPIDLRFVDRYLPRFIYTYLGNYEHASDTISHEDLQP